VEVSAGLAARHPDQARYAVALAEAYLELSWVYEQAHKPAQAIASLQQACTLLEKFVSRSWPPGTDLTAAQIGLARAYYNLGLQMGSSFFQRDQARRTWQKAYDLLTKIVAIRPGDMDLRYLLGITCFNLAAIQGPAVKPDEALALYRAACDHL